MKMFCSDRPFFFSVSVLLLVFFVFLFFLFFCFFFVFFFLLLLLLFFIGGWGGKGCRGFSNITSKSKLTAKNWPDSCNFFSKVILRGGC